MHDNDQIPPDPDATPVANESSRLKITLRRYADTPYESPFVYDEDEDTSTGFKRRWWHIAGALILIGVLLLEVLLPIIESLIAMSQLDPSTIGGRAL